MKISQNILVCLQETLANFQLRASLFGNPVPPLCVAGNLPDQDVVLFGGGVAVGDGDGGRVRGRLPDLGVH